MVILYNVLTGMFEIMSHTKYNEEKKCNAGNAMKFIIRNKIHRTNRYNN